LFGHERGLSLWQDDDCGNHLKLRKCGKVAEEYKRLVKHFAMGIPLPPWTVPGISTQDMIKYYDMFIAQSFYRLRIVAYYGWVCTNFGLRECDSNLHMQYLGLSLFFLLTF
jgi:hypothetical protein